MSNMIMKNVMYKSKERLISKVAQFVNEKEKSAGVNDQALVMIGYDVIEKIESLNRKAAYELEKAIMQAEEYDPKEDKFGFGPKEICPTDYLAFLPENLRDDGDNGDYSIPNSD